MVRQCVVCKKLNYLNPDISFHRLSANVERRKSWYSLLGFAEGKVLPKCCDICSCHFNENDFDYKPSGMKYLKKDAKPKPRSPTHSTNVCKSDSESTAKEIDETEVIDCDREDFLENLDELESNSCENNLESKLFTGNLKPNKVLALFPTTKEPSGEPHFVCTYIPVYELTSLDNKDVYRPDINVKEEIKLPVFNINVKEEIETYVPNLNVKEEIEIYDPNINIKEEIEVYDPNLNIKEEMNVYVPNINVKEEIEIYDPNIKEEIEVYDPNLNIKEEIDVYAPNINVKEEIEVYIPNIKDECA